MISRRDQVEKLREVLTGKALANLPPDGIMDIDQAWEYLEQAFGNPYTLLNFRLNKIRETVGLSDKVEENYPQFAADWYLAFGGVVDSIVKLGTRDLTLGMSCFNVDTIFTIIQKLPFHLVSKSYGLNARGEEKLKQILDLIKRARVKTLNRATDMTNMAPMALTPTPKPKESGHIVMNSSANTSSSQTHPAVSGYQSWTEICRGSGRLCPTSDNFYNGWAAYGKAPKKLSLDPNGRTNMDCRICKELGKSGKHRGNLYTGHYGNYPTHCPRWAEMNMVERLKTAHNAGFCIRCLSIDFIFTDSSLKQHHNNECYVNSDNKHKFSCLHKDCLRHSWVCKQHKYENRPLYETHIKEVTASKQKLSFSCICTAGPPTPIMSHRPAQSPAPSMVQGAAGYPTLAIVHHPAEPPLPCVRPPTTDPGISWVIYYAPVPLSQALDSQLLVHQEAHRAPSVGQPLRPPATIAEQANTESPVITIEADIPEGGLDIPEMLNRLKNLTPAGDTLITKMRDPPLFMFSSIPGMDSDVQIFYDGGNSHCLFREVTPRNLWGCLVKRGPHPLGAVGATTVWGGDSWACQPMTSQGSREVLIGIEVKQITTDFPMVDLTEATAEIKASKPEDAELQALNVPKMVGGQVDILLGIQYLSHFPKLVHSLDSGLGIYEVRLSPSSPCITAAISGPHHCSTSSWRR